MAAIARLASGPVRPGTPEQSDLRLQRPLSVTRLDLPQTDPAKGPATAVAISPAGLRLAGESTRRGTVSGSDTPTRVQRDTQAPARKAPANIDNQTTTRRVSPGKSPGPDQLGPRDAAARVQAFGGLNVRSSVGGPLLTSGT
ncbi:MAG: hypothetical protein H7338_11985 [Candidatus Sericytochromatia bacterium]|nr:hypothetical protein [Candidatus Sericytochromatia bacterium]